MEAEKKTLSLAPLGDWQEIAGKLRPDLQDLTRTWEKFQVFYATEAHAPAEWQKLWRLWLLREDEKHARRYTGVTRSDRSLGSFLSAKPDPTVLNAAYEVLHES